MDIDPLFTKDGFHIRAASPLVNAGAPADFTGQTDIDGQPRQIGGRTDIGADEVKRRRIKK